MDKPSTVFYRSISKEGSPDPVTDRTGPVTTPNPQPRQRLPAPAPKHNKKPVPPPRPKVNNGNHGNNPGDTMNNDDAPGISVPLVTVIVHGTGSEEERPPRSPNPLQRHSAVAAALNRSSNQGIRRRPTPIIQDTGNHGNPHIHSRDQGSTRSTDSGSSGKYSLSSEVSFVSDAEGETDSGHVSRVSLMSSASDSEDDVLDDDDDAIFDGWASDEFSENEEIYDNVDGVIQLQQMSEKCHHMAKEIMTTEETYSDRLFTMFKTMLTLDGANRVKHFLPENFKSMMFPNIETMYKYHAQNVCPSFRARLAQWETKPYVGDLWLEHLHVFSMYKLYASQVTDAQNLVIKYRETSSDFAAIMDELEAGEEYNKLGLEHYMLDPIQRLPRYRLLLQTYDKYLSAEDNPTEKQNIDATIGKLGEIIEACEETLKKQAAFGDFQKIQDRLADPLSVINPQAKLLMEGACVEVTASAYSREIPRYLFLFSDFMLICSKTSRLLLNNKLVIRKRLETDELRIRCAEHLLSLGYKSENTMMLKGKEKVVSFLFQDEETKDEWERWLVHAISKKLENAIRRQSKCQPIVETGNVADFQRAPIWIGDDKKTHCMMCTAKFNTLVRRRHHCRGCGIVTCAKCCSQKLNLPYQEEVGRVCNNCFLRARRDCPELTRRVSTQAKRVRKMDHVKANELLSPGTPKNRDSQTSVGSGVSVTLDDCPDGDDDDC